MVVTVVCRDSDRYSLIVWFLFLFFFVRSFVCSVLLILFASFSFFSRSNANVMLCDANVIVCTIINDRKYVILSLCTHIHRHAHKLYMPYVCMLALARLFYQHNSINCCESFYELQ